MQGKATGCIPDLRNDFTMTAMNKANEDDEKTFQSVRVLRIFVKRDIEKKTYHVMCLIKYLSLRRLHLIPNQTSTAQLPAFPVQGTIP